MRKPVYFTETQEQEIIRLYQSGLILRVIGKRYKVTPSRISKLLHRHGVEMRTSSNRTYLPTPAEIEAAKIEVRKTWADTERRVHSSEPHRPSEKPANSVTYRHNGQIVLTRGD